MAGKSKRDTVVDALIMETGDSPTRYTDFQLSVYAPDSCDPLIRVGGRWDSHTNAYTGPAELEVQLDVQRQQVPPAADVADWLTKQIQMLAYAVEHNCTLDQAIDVVWGDDTPWYRLLLIGGRRAGKTWFACLLIALVAFGIPGAFLVIISPTRTHTNEIHKTLQDFLPINAREWRASEHV